MQEVTNFRCFACKDHYPITYKEFHCKCGGLLEVIHNWDLYSPKNDLSKYINSSSGVWRFKPLIHPFIDDKYVIKRGEGHTGLYSAPTRLQKFVGSSKILIKHEGENPTGSFKDRGMSVAISEAKNRFKTHVICASTGNTSASLAAYASYAGLKSTVVIPEGKIAFGKLAQAIAYGAEVFQSEGTFDQALEIVQTLVYQKNYYLMNSINPWRIEGQKTIIFEILEQLDWQTPDWLVVPAGNLGNTAAFGKALKEAKELDLINNLPRIISVQSEKAQPFVQYWKTNVFKPETKPQTIATAINIGNPVSIEKAMKSLKDTQGMAISVSDQEIVDVKAIIDNVGIGCEPASATTVAGTKNLIDEGIILPTEHVVAILTGHLLKDPQIIIDYHQESLTGFKSNYANKIKSIKSMQKKDP